MNIIEMKKWLLRGFGVSFYTLSKLNIFITDYSNNQCMELLMISKSDNLTNFEIETSVKTISVKKRYLEIKSKCQTIAELASYEKVIEALDIIEKN